jgi:hypothetical protein
VACPLPSSCPCIPESPPHTHTPHVAPLSTPQAMAHGSGWGALDGGCHPPPPSPCLPTCTLYPPHKQLLAAVVLGAGCWCSWAFSSIVSLAVVVVVVVLWPLSLSYSPGASAFHLTSSGLSAWGWVLYHSLLSTSFLFPLQCHRSTHYPPHKQ